MQRIQYIDRLKGLAIILVVMGHVFGFKQPMDGINTFIYTFHMPLFLYSYGQ
jgi:fucose 4-O-acetylase-like acetyltransferase